MATVDALAAARPHEDFEARRIAAAVRRRFIGTPLATIGRYHIEARIGGGATGFVYRAFDPELRRRVAIKLLHEGTDTMLRQEATALAQVEHAGVVRVFDISRTHHGLALVMELVEGSTLRDTLRSDRSDREVLALFVAAGRGLAHMHALGLVHRDFKPENVIVDPGGAPRLVDFGLVRTVGSVVRAGEGTPGYAAPEQIAGGLADARSDQFSFCAALMENLPPGARRRVCAAVLRRGLSPRMEDRWPSMTALLDALRSKTPRRRWWWMTTVVACATLGATLWARADTTAPCDEVLPRELAWTGAKRTSVDAALRAHESTTQDRDAAEGVVARLDDHANAWLQTRAELCDANIEPDAARVGCLREISDELDALTAAIVDGTRSAGALARQAAARLTEPRRCLEDRIPAFYATPPDSATRAAVTELAAARIALTTGDHARAAAESEAIWRASPRTECRVSPRAALLAAYASSALDERPRALDWIDRALWEGMRCADDWTVIDAAALAVSQGDHSAFDRYAPVAEAGLDALDWPPRLGANYLLATSQAKLRRGDRAAAVADARRGLALIIEAAGEDSIDVIAFHVALGATLGDSSKLDEAMPHLERALELSLRHHGPDHPSTGRAMMNVGSVQAMLGRDAEAEAALVGALEVRGAQFGPEHPEMLVPLVNLGSVRIGLRKLDEARANFEAAAAILQQHPEPQLEGYVIERLGIIAIEQGRFEDAAPLLERSRVLRVEQFGSDHTEVAWSVLQLATLQRKRGVLDEAERLLVDALATATVSAANDPELVATTHERFADLRSDQDRPAEAIPHYERALAIRDAGGRRGGDVGALLLGLALAHRAEGQEPRAREYATRARAEFALARWTDDVARVDAFLHSQTQIGSVAGSQPPVLSP